MRRDAAEPAADGGESGATDAQAGGEDAGGPPCRDDADCDNHKFCDGRERCHSGKCEDGPPPCASAQSCGEAAQRCDCDYDRDGVLSARCGGTDCDEDNDGHYPRVDGCPWQEEHWDCDDGDARRHSDNVEVCDAEGVDEDCDWNTCAGLSEKDGPSPFDVRSDRDQDGTVSADCVNIDPLTLQIYAMPPDEADCDDADSSSRPGAREICDDADNDCDGFVDEIEGSAVSHGLKQTFCPDFDGDGSALRGPTIQLCGLPSVGYSACPRADQREDCDDADPEVHPGPKVLEVCDNKDNDCDGKIDRDDRDVDPLPDQDSSDDETPLACEKGEWVITGCPEGRAWCDPSTVVHGCETDILRLDRCRSCEPTQCSFSCGARGCDELQSVSVGYQHACAVTAEGRVACWGRGSDGRLGNDSLVSSTRPGLVVGLSQARSVSAGFQHSCAIVGDEGTVYCWGDNQRGQLGSAEGGASSPTPVTVVSFETDRVRDAIAVAAGLEHTCSVSKTGTVWCWGEASNGRLGDSYNQTGALLSRRVHRQDPLAPSGFSPVTDAVSLVAGDGHSCLIDRAGRVACWGDNTYGQLGDPALGQQTFLPYAHPVPGLVGVTSIAAGDAHTCALMGSAVWCWGNNANAQLGRASDAPDVEPKVVAGIEPAVAIEAGIGFSCALTVRGETFCWGLLNLGEPDEFSGPTKVPVPASKSLAAGGFACALDTTPQLRCWGDNFFGQLGTGVVATLPTFDPKPVVSLIGSHSNP